MGAEYTMNDFQKTSRILSHLLNTIDIKNSVAQLRINLEQASGFEWLVELDMQLTS